MLIQKHPTYALGAFLGVMMLAGGGIGLQALNSANLKAETAEIQKELAKEKAEKEKQAKIIAEIRAKTAETELKGQSQSLNKLQSLEHLTQNENYYSAALQIINTAIQESPQFWKPYLVRAKHFGEYGKHEKADQDFQKAQELFMQQHKKESTEIWFEAGMYYGLPNELGGRKLEAKALPYFEKAAKDKKNVFGQLARAAELIIKAEMKPEEAEEYLEEADELTKKLTLDETASSIDATRYVRAWLLGAGIFENKKQEIFKAYLNLEEAKKCLLSVVSEDKGPIGARSFLAGIYLNLGDAQKAINIYTDLIKTQEKLYLYHNRGISYHRTGLLEEAIQDYTRAIEIPDDPSGLKHSSYYNRGIIFFQNKKEYSKAIDDFSEAIALMQGIQVYYEIRGLIYFIIEDYSNSFPDTKKSLELNPKAWISNSIMGELTLMQGKYKEALEYKKRALEYIPPERQQEKAGIIDTIQKIEQHLEEQKRK